MTHSKKRYIIMPILAFAFAIIGMYFLNSDRAISAILFNAAILSIPLVLGFLFIDYTLTLLNRHTLMKYYYAAVFLTLIMTIIAVITQNPAITLARDIAGTLLSIATVIIIALFFRYAFMYGHEELQNNTPHIMDKLADAYQKQKVNPKSWEEQSFDFFAAKFGSLSKGNPSNEEKVSI